MVRTGSLGAVLLAVAALGFSCPSRAQEVWIAQVAPGAVRTGMGSDRGALGSGGQGPRLLAGGITGLPGGEPAAAAGLGRSGTSDLLLAPPAGDVGRPGLPQAGTRNAIGLVQDGFRNEAALIQGGFGNHLTVAQSGDGLAVSVHQAGSGNTVTLQQSGILGMIQAVQLGQGNQLGAIQGGTGHRLTVVQR
ncbi:hypothetical protein DK419_14620 [Methylobacterium terrae]|uniref:Curlin n=2 Tax=Methylobacterium terrae TaxID=2202827 RepID=A0A2U8WMS7_9HYPH|nr:hypothetical protein DK419_14620 [Methylobacterium terrae]